MKSIFLIPFMVFMFYVFSMGHVHALDCPAQKAGKVSVSWKSDPIRYDFTKSQRQMDAMENDTVSPYARDAKTHVGGLMKGGIALESRIMTSALGYERARKICQWIDEVRLDLRIDPKIYITREHRKGSCKHNAIMEHEMKHVYVDRDIVKKYVPIFKRRLQDAVMKVGIVGPKDERDQKRYQQKINDYIESQIAAVNNQMTAERRQRQQAIDTLEEYERVARMCG